MNLADLTSDVADRLDVSQNKAHEAVVAVFESIEQALLRGHEVKLGAVGKLFVKKIPAHETKSFGQSVMHVPDRLHARFQAFATFKKHLNPNKEPVRHGGRSKLA